MSGARGRPRRGTAWYAFESRRKRKQKFETVLAMACKLRARKTRKPWMPPMVYVEEVVLEEPIQVQRLNLSIILIEIEITNNLFFMFC
jgi:hypothetical protein